jgi:hypothetical protein
MDNIEESLDRAMAIEGAVGVALVDFRSGSCLGVRGGGDLDMELAGAGTTEVIRAQKAVIEQVGMDEPIDDILVTIETQHHLFRLFDENNHVYSYLVLDREQCRLGLARTHLKVIDQELTLPSRQGPES